MPVVFGLEACSFVWAGIVALTEIMRRSALTTRDLSLDSFQTTAFSYWRYGVSRVDGERKLYEIEGAMILREVD